MMPTWPKRPKRTDAVVASADLAEPTTQPPPADPPEETEQEAPDWRDRIRDSQGNPVPEDWTLDDVMARIRQRVEASAPTDQDEAKRTRIADLDRRLTALRDFSPWQGGWIVADEAGNPMPWVPTPATGPVDDLADLAVRLAKARLNPAADLDALETEIAGYEDLRAEWENPHASDKYKWRKQWSGWF